MFCICSQYLLNCLDSQENSNMKDSPLLFHCFELSGFSIFLKVPEMSPAFTHCMKPGHSICHSIICLTKKNAQQKKSHTRYIIFLLYHAHTDMSHSPFLNTTLPCWICLNNSLSCYVLKKWILNINHTYLIPQILESFFRILIVINTWRTWMNSISLKPYNMSYAKYKF